MDFKIEMFLKGSLGWLRKEVDLKEPIDYDCRFIVARKNGEFVGLIGINFIKAKMPQLEHTLIMPKFHKTRAFVQLLNKMEDYLQSVGAQGYISFILYSNKKMTRYAEKWGMEEYNKRLHGAWFAKKLEVPLCV